jgi:phospholipid N-methyltransferase
MGAIAPSSPNLARAMARWVPADESEIVLELGPGTGVVTEALLKQGLPANRLMTIEKSPQLSVMLQKRFPGVNVIAGDAWEMDKLLSDHELGVRRVGTVISSLPLRHFKPEEVERLAGKIRGILRPGGCWVLFLYHFGSERPRGAAVFRLLSSRVVWLNLPPARVNVYQKPPGVPGAEWDVPAPALA